MKSVNYNHLYYFWMVARRRRRRPRQRGADGLAADRQQPAQGAGDGDGAPAVRPRRAGAAAHGGRARSRSTTRTRSSRSARRCSTRWSTAGRAERCGWRSGVLDVHPQAAWPDSSWRRRCELPQPVRLVCREDKADRLLADLAARRTDVVLSDAPIGTGVQVRGYNHLLGESGVSFFATPRIAARSTGGGFPKSLERRAGAAADRPHAGAAVAQPMVRLEAHPPRRRRGVRRQRADVLVRPHRRRASSPRRR